MRTNFKPQFQHVFDIIFLELKIYFVYSTVQSPVIDVFRMSQVSNKELCNLAYGGHGAVLDLRLEGIFPRIFIDY